MNKHGVSRRGFMGGLAGAAAALNLVRASSARGAEANSKLTAGIIGLGGRGGMIAKMVQDHGGYQITAVADYFPEVAKAAGEQFDVPEKRRFSGLNGYKGLIESGVDTVFFETPPYCFPDHVSAAAEAGCHIYLAKPVACDVPGCLRIEAAAKLAKEKGKVFLIDFQMRTDPFVIEGVKRVQDGEIGKIGLLSSLYTDESFKDPAFTANIESRLQHLVWVNDTAIGGSYFVNAGIHALDVALWLAGAKPLSCIGASRIARDDPHGDSHDVYSLTYEFPNGLILNHRGEHLKNRFDFHCECVAHCQNGYLETAYFGRTRMLGISTGWAGGDVVELYAQGARRNIATFHDSITKGDTSNPTAEPGVTATLATILGREAAVRGARLTWDEMMKENKRVEPDLSGLTA